MYSIENPTIKVSINPKGAELCNLILKSTNTDFMWSGNPDFWGKSSPVLFPIVGGLKDNKYVYQNKTYHLTRHGFARDRLFEIESIGADYIIFLIKSDAESLGVYPFDFEFRIKYQIYDNQLTVSYLVSNISSGEMLFSVGGHPAFAVPIAGEGSYTDCFLAFSEDEELMRYPLTKDGLIINQPIEVLRSRNQIHLTKELFYDDALVFKNLKSDSVILKSEKSNHQLKFDFAGFPFLGIWAAKNADFVCIEPWCGIADSETHDYDFAGKEGIVKLDTGRVFERSWRVTLE